MSDVREYFKRWPKTYFFIGEVFGPMMFCGLSSRSFLKKYKSDGEIVNLGSGPRILGTAVKNVDLYNYPGVNVVSDICKTPLESDSVDRIVCDNVLEHVKDPKLAVAEMLRILKKGGVAYIAVPFLYPFHSSPSDYQRYSKEGLKFLFNEFEMVEIGTRAGPFSALTVYLCHLFGLIFSFGSLWLNSLITNLVMFLLFPIKLLDLIFNHWPNLHNGGGNVLCRERNKIVNRLKIYKIYSEGCFAYLINIDSPISSKNFVTFGIYGHF